MTAVRVARWMAFVYAMLTSILGMSMVPIELVIPLALVGAIWTATVGHAFIILYWVREKWWKSSIGRHLMAFMTGLTVIIDLTIANFLMDDMPGRPTLTLFAWTVLPVLFTWRLMVLIGVKNFDGNGNARHK